MSLVERETMRLKLRHLGRGWDKRLCQEWLDVRPAALLAHDYGLELATIDAVLPAQIKRRKAT